LKEDNIMTGDRFSDRQPQASNPFLFLVTLGKQGEVLQHGERVQLQAPAPGPAARAKVSDTISIDADIIP